MLRVHGFCQLSEQLIARAAAASIPETLDRIQLVPAPLARPTITTTTPNDSATRKVSIPLVKLFKYPTDESDGVAALLNRLDYFWKGGIMNLEKRWMDMKFC